MKPIRRNAFLCLLGLFAIGVVWCCWSSPVRTNAMDRAEDECRPVLHPEVLKDVRVATVPEIRQNFQDPPPEFRLAPLWVWNDEMTLDRIKEQLRQFEEQGIGGVFIHARAGLMTEYLGDEWFALWKGALQEAKRLGLLCNIYDENNYPSGYAGGLVPASAPDTDAQYVQAELTQARPAPSNDALASPDSANLAMFKVELDASGRPVHAVRIPDRELSRAQGEVAIFHLRRASGNPWTAQFPYTDLTNPETGRMFIQTTFEAYKKAVGEEFGETVKWSFDDEPRIAMSGTGQSDALSLPLSYNTLSEFRRRHGYDLKDELPSLYWDVGDWRKVRFDYWQTLHDLWKENYFSPIFQWCDHNGIGFTGHYMEHTWPYPWISPDDASMYAFQHAPGIDMIVGTVLGQHGVDPHMLFTIRQVASVAHQLGRRGFCEVYGAGGWDKDFQRLKQMGDWLIVHGINFFSPHLAYTTIRGARKRDYPQSFSDVAAWWPYYRLHADHMARLCYALAQGVAPNRLLVLEPTTSGFLWARRGGDTPELKQLVENYDTLNQFLADHQMDFDLGDEYLIEWFGASRGKHLVIANAAYDLLVWPKGMTNLRHQTLPVLQKYLEAGGEVLALDPPAAYVDGRTNTAVEDLQRRFTAQWHLVPNLQALLVEIRRRLPPRVEFDREVPSGVAHRMEVLQNGDALHFFTNSTWSPVSVTARVEGAAMEEWDTATGKMQPVYFRPSAGKAEFRLDLPPIGSRLFYVSRRPASQPVGPPTPHLQVANLMVHDLNVSPASPNVLVLDYCDLRAAGQTFHDINTWQANWFVWQAHGFERPAWDNEVQFKRTILDHPPFPPGSGFEATFHFRVADSQPLQGMQLAVETPELYQVYLNEQLLDFSNGQRWLDPHIRSLAIEKSVKIGDNTIRVVASPFNVRMELENIYIRGNFFLQPERQGFSIHAARPLEFNSWAKSGYPFYPDSVLYQGSINVPQGSDLIRISFPHWAGSVAVAVVDGKTVQVVGWQPFECSIGTTPGSHLIGLRVVGTPRNLFGPFHSPMKPRMIGAPQLWAHFPEHQPPGDQYDQIDYGLLAPFSVEALR